MQITKMIFAFLTTVEAVYLSTLVAPMQSSPGTTLGMSSIKTLDLDSLNVTTSIGILGEVTIGGSSFCQLSSNPSESPITTSSITSTIYTVCSSFDPARLQIKVLASGSVLGSSSYDILGSTASFGSAVVQRLTTDNGTNFYILTRTEPGNSTVWWIPQGGDLTVIQNGTEDGWNIQSIEIIQGSLMGIGNRVGNPFSRSIIWWGGRGLPRGLQPPQPYPGLLASNGNNLIAFAFSDPSTLWVVSGASAAGGSPILMMYLYNRQTLTWTIGGYYLFNATQPAPTAIFIGGKPPITRFLGVAPSAILEYSIPPSGGGGSYTTTIQSRPLLSADRGTSFRGLAVSSWSPPPSPSLSATSSGSATATATSSSSASATSTATQSAYVTNTAFATFSAPPTQSSYASAASTSTATPSPTPTLSLGLSPTSSPTITVTSSPTPTESRNLGSSPSDTPTQSSTPTPSSTPSSTPTFQNATGGAAAAIGTNVEDLKVGFGVGVPIVFLIVGIIALYMLFKSGKLLTMWKPKPNYFRHGYGGRAPRVPMKQHPILRENPLQASNVKMNYNSKLLEQMRSQKFTTQQLQETQTVMTESGDRTVIKTKIRFSPQLSTLHLPGTPSVGSSV
jgi:hypothetical protein